MTAIVGDALPSLDDTCGLSVISDSLAGASLPSTEEQSSPGYRLSAAVQLVKSRNVAAACTTAGRGEHSMNTRLASTKIHRYPAKTCAVSLKKTRPANLTAKTLLKTGLHPLSRHEEAGFGIKISDGQTGLMWPGVCRPYSRMRLLSTASPSPLSTPSVSGMRECGSKKRKDDILTIVADLHRPLVFGVAQKNPHRKTAVEQAQAVKAPYICYML